MEDLTALVERGRAGQSDAREELVKRFQDMAVGYAYSVLGDFHAAEDAAQDAFVEALGALASLEVSQAFPSWFRRVIYKHCDRKMRRRRETLSSPADLRNVATPAPGPDRQLEQRDLEGWLTEAIRRLPDEERMVTSLFYMGDCTHQQLAEFLEMPLATVNNRLRSARKRLKKEILEMAEKDLRSKAPSRDDSFLNVVGLRAAIDVGDVARVRTLVEHRPELLLQRGTDQRRPLNDAALAGNPEIVQVLLEAGADPSFAHYAPRAEE